MKPKRRGGHFILYKNHQNTENKLNKIYKKCIYFVSEIIFQVVALLL